MKQGLSSLSSDLREPVYTFGSLRLESDGTLLRGNAVIHLPPKELAALRFLLANSGHIVTPQQLTKALWGDVHVTADSAPRCVSSLRAMLQPDDCIQTVYKRGYRFVSAVQRYEPVAPGSMPRLAIMPFTTGINVPDHLGSAIAEETITRLSGGRSSGYVPFSMLARDSVFTLAERGLSAQEVGEALDADLVLAGNLRALPSHHRLRVEMIGVENGAQIWVEDLLVAQARVAGLESELVERLVSRLDSAGAGTMPTNASAREDELAPARREAYEKFQIGHQELHTLQRFRIQEGLQHLSRATELDPLLLPAQVDLVNVCVTQAFYGFMPPALAAEQVHRTANAIPNNAEWAAAILPALGWIRFHVDLDLPQSERAFAESAHLPHDPWTTRARVMFALSRHRFGEALGLLHAALGVDPYSPWLNARLAWTLHLAGDAAKSHEQIERVLSLFPDHEVTNLYGAIILAYNGESERAVKLAEKLAKRSPYFDIATAIHSYSLACAGRVGESREILERLQWLGRERYVLNSFTPAALVVLGDLEGAIAELRAAEEARCPWFFQMLADPRLKPLHTHPQFLRMQGKLAAMEANAARKRREED